MALRSVIFGLMLLYGVCGFSLIPSLDLSILKKRAPSGGEVIVQCVLQDIVNGKVSRSCADALSNAPDTPAKRNAACSSACDSLYVSVAKCAGEEITRSIYSQECTNGYQGPQAG